MPLTDTSDSLQTRNLTVHDLLALADDTPLEVREMSVPTTPAGGRLLVYAKTDGKLYAKNDGGTEFDLTASGGGGGGSGDVVGPGSATDNAAVRFDSTTGKLVQDSGVVIDDSNNVSGVGSVTLSGTVDGRDVAADGTKLDTIETNADVTDGTNVAAAGAVMDGDFTVDGLCVRTASGTYANRTLTGTASKITVSNGDGVSGNPTVTIPDSVTLVTPTIADLTNATHDHADNAGGGVLGLGAVTQYGPLAPTSAVPDTSGETFPNIHSSSSKYRYGMGVAASLATADRTWHLEFPVPSTLPAGTCKLVLIAVANATSGAAKVNPKWVSVADEEDSFGATRAAEGTTTVTWSTGDAHVEKRSEVTLDADTVTAGETIVMDLVFEISSWTLAAVSTWRAFLVWA